MVTRSDNLTNLRSETVSDVLSSASAVAYGRFSARAVGAALAPERTGGSNGEGVNGNGGDSGWIAAEDLLEDPDGLLQLSATAGPGRFRSTDRELVLGQVARESVAALVTAAVHTWSCQRRLLDVSASNVLLRDGDVAVVAALRRPVLAVLPGDPLVPEPDVEVVDEPTMFQRLLSQTLGYPLSPGPPPDRRPERVAAVAAVIAALRQLVRSGDRHLWGSVALAAVNGLTHASHAAGDRARSDLGALVSARPDLARTVELVTTHDARDEPITFALRRTCCLLYKLPDGAQCATCSLADRASRVASLGEWHRAERNRFT